ncbi:MAG: thiol-disulfide isomerase/thioredoxin [Cellvibrionaceae bacterium]|jgi:thiol-disulfide isomerase/thioredoxin
MIHFPQSRQAWLKTLVVSAVLGIIWLTISRESAVLDTTTLTIAPSPGNLAPDFTLTTLDGDQIQLTQLRGKPVIINFWATWCGPCRQETPQFQSFHERFGDEVILLGINQHEELAQINSFVSEFGMTYPVLLDVDGSVYDDYQVFGLPTTWFVNPDGVLTGVAPGGITEAFLEDQLNVALNR